MFQNYRADHIAKTVAQAGVVVDDLANPSVKVNGGATPYVKRINGRNQGTSSNVWLGAAVSVYDPELRGPMVLSFQFAVIGKANAIRALPVVFDNQASTHYAAGASVPIAAATDFQSYFPNFDVAAFEHAASGTAMICGMGRCLVNTSIETATGGVVARDFGVGVAMELAAAGAYDTHWSLQCRLHSTDELVFQPSK